MTTTTAGFDTTKLRWMENPHLERGGPDGAVIFSSHHTTDGRLYELVDDGGNVIHTVTIDEIIDSWETSD